MRYSVQQETVQGSSMDGYSTTGNWKDLAVGSVTAIIRKYDDENTISVTVGPVGKKAVIPDSKGYLNQKEVGTYRDSGRGRVPATEIISL